MKKPKEHNIRPEQAEEEILALAKFSDQNPNPVFRVSGNGTLLYANKVGLELLTHFGKEFEDLLKESWKAIFHEVQKSQGSLEREIRFGERLYLLTVSHVGDASYLYIYGQDVTERRKLDQLKDEFVSTVSHELRIPLTIVKGAVSNLRDGVLGVLSEKQRDGIEIAARNVDRLQRLISDLLDLSRLESGKARVRFQKLHLAALVKETFKNFQRAAKKRGLLLQSHLLPALPDAFGDLDMVHQVLNNLMDNALRYAKTKISIEIQEVSSPNKLRLAVLDDGAGIVEANHQIIFDRFKQIERPMGGGGYKGTGLGLTIAKQIVERHAGKIWVESNPGKGAHFYFTLPIYDEQTNVKTALEGALVGAREFESPLSVLGLSLKNFDLLKEKYGEQKLQNKFEALKDHIHQNLLRKSDELFQYHGHLILLLSETARSHALAVQERLRQSLEEKREDLDMELQLATYPDDAAQSEQLLKKIGIPS